ncbi:MAG: hypothetical protein HUU38_02695 [Anaerolineales bacterium]|nr:hypothetical protein [Anaerolineales bacterium]
MEGLLKTKLFAPAARHSLVARHSLLEKLNAGLANGIPLTLVCAPAGFGKTTLVGDWVARTGIPFAWLTLDEGDNDPVRFWRYVDAMFQMIDKRLGEGLRPALFSLQPPAIRQVLTGLVNDIVERNMPFIVVLEDYHLIDHADIHENVNFLLDHLPPGAYLVVTTRSDPPLHLARRRGRAQVSEIRAADLRFSLDETVDFINETMRLGMSLADIAALERRTEGWIAGLQMAALSLQDESDPHAFVMAFSGDDRHIADYLIEEVLQRQPLDFQRFLLQTSILTRLSAPLCDAVTGRGDSRAILNTLERTNLFILPLDNRREWFRYHQLFAQLLQKRLLDTEGDEAKVNALKRAASQWYAENNHIVEAVEIALAIKDYDQACTLIERSNALLFMGAELNMLRKWATMIPASIVATRPRLNVMAAWANHATGHPDQAEVFVQLLEYAAGVRVEDFLGTFPAARGLTPIQRSALLEGTVIRTRMAVDSLELDRAFTLANLALPHLVPTPDESHAFNLPEHLHCVELFNLGLVHKFRDDLDRAVDVLGMAVAEAKQIPNPHIIALGLGHLGETQIAQGELKAAQKTFEQAQEESKNFPPRSSAFWGMSSTGLGNIAYERNDLANAEICLLEGVELGKLWSSWECLLPGMTGLARLHAARGEWDRAYSALEDLLEWGALNALLIRPAVEAARAGVQLRQGNLSAAIKWAKSVHRAEIGRNKLQWIQDALLAARIDLAQGNNAQAESLLQTLLPETDRCNRFCLEAQCLQALLFDVTHRPKEAVATLQAVLERAEPKGYVRLFVDEGEKMQGLLTRTGRETPARAGYVSKLLAAFSVTFTPDQKPAQAGLVEPLTERELEVLNYIAQGLSNPEIAKRLFLSPNTLKAHSQNIFSKLNVHNRVEATNRARELGLV